MLQKMKPGRNDPCPCGSGKKSKNCCASVRRDTEARSAPSVSAALTPAQMNELLGLINAARHTELEIRARALLERQPECGFFWKLLSMALKMQGKEALQALRSTTRLLPEDAEAHTDLGNALLDIGQFDEALSSHRRAVELNPDFAGAHSNLGNALHSLGRPAEALVCFRRALQLQPDFVQAHNNLGNALCALGRFDDALACYRRALELKPDYAEAHNNMGNALRDLGQLDHAVASYRRALLLKPAYPEAHNNLGNALRDLSQLDDAVASFRLGLALRPAYPELHSNLGNALFDLGQLDDAVASYRRALELKPDYAEAHNNMGNALRDRGQLDHAVERYQRALLLKPAYPEAHNNLGNALRDLGQLNAATASYRQALALTPGFAEAHNNLSIVLRLQGRAAEAEASCRAALAIEPNRATTMVLLADFHADKGQFDEAEALYRRAISIAPQLAEAWAGIARWRKMTISDAAWLADVQRLAAQRLPPRKQAYLRYALGKYFDDVKDFEQAFHNYRQANELAKLYKAKHDRGRLTQTIDFMIGSCDQTWVRRASVQAVTSSRPVFIVGMPRSGTTLTEQILASHPSVFGAGELPFWRAASAAHGSMLGRLADDYLQLLADLSPGALRVVDKLPGNFMLLGLIHAALPNARIIHMRRNPIDTCLSIYFQHFQSADSYINDLEDLAHYYTEYLRIMTHWRSVLPPDSLLEVPYEGLIDEPEAWSRRMLKFIGLPWEPRCLEFHRTERAVFTASKWQVRQKINKESLARWHNYEKYVAPLMQLQSAI
jgi:tetratricopeptide (TPR) repeat protein